MAIAAGVAVLTGGTALGGSGVLPPDTQGRLLSAIAPARPGEPITASCDLGDIRIDQATITLEIRCGSTATKLVLQAPGGPGQPGIRVGATPSFLGTLRDRSSPAAQRATVVLLERLRAADNGGFFQAAPSEVEAPSDRHHHDPQIPLEAPVVPVSWTLALGLCLLLVTGIHGVALHRPRREDVLWFVGLLVLSFAAREALSPHTFLHENSRGPRELEALLGGVAIVRPMGGQQALQSWFAMVFGPSISTMILATTLASAAGPPALYALGRALRLRPLAAATAGLALAALPVAVRFGGSADAFPMAATLLILSCLGLALATRQDSHGGGWWVFAGAAAALAGTFRPACYALVPALAMGPVLLAEAGHRGRWLKQPPLWAGAACGLVVALPDVLPSLATLGGGSALTMGWWSRPGIRSWPLVDPEVTPVFFLVLAGIGGLLAGIRRPDLRPGLAWMLILGGALSFLYSSDNGWPASLRYGVVYSWIPALLLAFGFEALPVARDRGRLTAFAVTGLLCLSPLLTHGRFVGHSSAQQDEVAFQLDRVIPRLLAVPEPGMILTPWPTLDHMSGTLLTRRLRDAGWSVATHEDARRVLKKPGGGDRIWWYRGLACWAQPVRGAQHRRGLHPTCGVIERMAPWRPEVMVDLGPQSDADWIVLGRGDQPVEIGLFRLGTP